MNGPHFFQTRMGRVFFEVEMPRLYRAISRLAQALEPTEVEYKTIDLRVSIEEVEGLLNDAAKDGWKVVFMGERWCALERVVPREDHGG
jgi:hypothetical protein